VKGFVPVCKPQEISSDLASLLLQRGYACRGDKSVLQDEGQSLMRAAMTQLNLSARAYHRVLKLARTIADLAGSEEIQSTHLAEALQYRPKLMMG